MGVIVSGFRNKTPGVKFFDAAAKDHEPIHIEGARAVLGIAKLYFYNTNLSRVIRNMFCQLNEEIATSFCQKMMNHFLLDSKFERNFLSLLYEEF